MADVRVGGPEPGGGVDRRLAGRPRPSRDGHRPDRGQLILVTALSLAILFVSLALILNTAIYTENLATRSSDIAGGTDAVRYHDAARDAVGGVIGYANHHNQTDQDTLQANLSGGVNAFRNYSARQFAYGDRAVETSLDSLVNGTRIGQTDTTRNFTNESGTGANWTVVQGVSNSRAIEINVTDASVLVTASDRPFNLTLTNASGATWRLNVTNPGTTTIGVKNGTGAHFECTASTNTPVIDVTAGTIDGTACEGLELAEGLDGSYDISIGNGDHGEGTYSMVVNNQSLADTVDTGPYPHLAADGSDQPFAAHAIYSANVTVVYQTPRLYYNTTVRVAPGEPDG